MSGADQTRLKTMAQQSQFDSPWSLWGRIKIGLWSVVWLLLFRPTPKPMNGWRRMLLRLFGARIHGRAFVSPSAKIKMPWNLEMHDRACLAPGSEVYNLGPCVIKARASITQYVYLCGGTHDLSNEHLPLIVARIVIEEDAWVGAGAMILPGVIVGQGAVVGAGSVVTKDVAPWVIVAGNPARELKKRLHPRSIYGAE